MAGKKIADAVHGTVQLSELESAVISTPAYQRLRGVKQLGMASLVFPGADYSRFSHGVGTCHITGRVISALQAAHSDRVTQADIDLYRMAALLHDIGHYPFSHTFERALKNHYSKVGILADGDNEPEGPAESRRMLHEEVGTHVIEADTALSALLSSGGIDIKTLEHIITRVEPPKFANLVSSDLDADRIDYLLRTALHTGLPYGHVDLDYLLSQIRLDQGDRICYRSKGMRAAEHLLLARFYDYQQVSYHKTVQALELVLNEAVEALLRTRKLDCSVSSIKEMITNGRWASFDDAYIISLIRLAADDPTFQDDEKLLFRSVLDRNPPKLVVEREQFCGPEGMRTLTSLEKLIKKNIASWSEEFGVKFWPWATSVSLTKIGQSVPVTTLANPVEDETYDKILQSVLILPEGKPDAVPLQDYPRSIIPLLSQSALYTARVYVLLPVGDDRIEVIRQRVNEDLLDMWS